MEMATRKKQDSVWGIEGIYCMSKFIDLLTDEILEYPA